MSDNYAIKNSYRIIKEMRLIVEYHKGVGKLEDAIAFRTIQAADPDFSPDFDIIMDLRDLLFDVQFSDMKGFGDFYLQNINLMGKRHNALITETPSQVVVATLFKRMNVSLPQTIKVVSTVGAAINWVNSELSGQQVTAIIEELKQKAI